MITRFAKMAATAALKPFGLEVRRADPHGSYAGPRPPAMEARHVEHCEVLPSRAELLRRLPSGGIAAEVGVDRGNFADAILRFNKPTRLHLVDAWGGALSDGHEHVADRFRQEIAAGAVVIDRGMSVDILASFPDADFDWVYIDTDHSYDTTLAELVLSARKVKPDGYIAGHDFAQANRTGGRYGVIPACHQFCNEHGWQLAFLTVEYDSFSSFCLRRI